MIGRTLIVAAVLTAAVPAEAQRLGTRIGSTAGAKDGAAGGLQLGLHHADRLDLLEGARGEVTERVVGGLEAEDAEGSGGS